MAPTFAHGLVAGVALTMVSLPAMKNALEKMAQFDDDAAGRQLSEMLRLSDMAVLLSELRVLLGIYIELAGLLVQFLISLLIVQLFNTVCLVPFARQRSRRLTRLLQSPLLGLVIAAAIVLGSLLVLFQPPSRAAIASRAAELDPKPPPPPLHPRAWWQRALPRSKPSPPEEPHHAQT